MVYGVETVVTVSSDERRPLEESMRNFHFISQGRKTVYALAGSRPSPVFKDYILSPETYVLA